MKIQKVKLMVVALSVVLIIASGCSKQQYRARSKRYPHEAPTKQ